MAVDFLTDLHRQLPRGAEHQHLSGGQLHVERLQGRQGKGCGLAGAGLREPDNVAALQRYGNGLRLNGGGDSKPRAWMLSRSSGRRPRSEKERFMEYEVEKGSSGDPSSRGARCWYVVWRARPWVCCARPAVMIRLAGRSCVQEDGFGRYTALAQGVSCRRPACAWGSFVQA